MSETIDVTEPFHAYELTLSGTPLERGRIHGETLRPQIRDALDGSADARRRAGQDPDAIDWKMIHEAGFLTAAERWTPGLVEEVRGIADGAAVSFDTLMAWQLIQEMAWFPATLVGAASDSEGVLNPVATACTSLGSCASSTSTIVAQTVDGTGWGHGRELITHLTDPETDIQTHIVGWPGHIGVYGVNSRGIGVCCNSMFLDVSNSTTGLGALFTVRGVLAQRTFEGVDRFIRGVSHASGTNFMVGGPGHAVSYEVSANGVTAYKPWPDAKITYHTNHAIAQEDKLPPTIPAGNQPGWDTNTKARFASVARRMNAKPAGMTWEEAREVLSSHDDAGHPICRHFAGEREGMTLYGLVMECSAARPVLHISTGPPCSTEFRDFGF